MVVYDEAKNEARLERTVSADNQILDEEVRKHFFYLAGKSFEIIKGQDSPQKCSINRSMCITRG